MSFRGWLILSLLLAAAWGGYWLYANVPLYALAFNDGKQWSLLSSGWEMFYRGWFFVVPGIIVVCLILMPLFGWLYGQADDADHLRALAAQKLNYEQKISGLRERLTLAEKRAENALSDAKQKYDTAIAKAEKSAIQAQSDIKKGKSMQAQALEYAKQSKEDAEKASLEATRATKKKNNAMTAAERIKRREARLRAN